MRLEEGILSNLRMPFLYPIFIKVCLLIFFDYYGGESERG